jgi:hypothetical protein
MSRLVIFPKDIESLTGVCERQARLDYNHLLTVYGKTKRQKITIKEFCKFYRLDEEEVKREINKKP